LSLSRVLVAMAVVSSIVLLVHRYIWARLVRDPAWAAPWGRTLGIAIVVLAVLVPLGFIAMRALPRSIHAPLAWIVYGWMGLVLYLFLFAVLTDAGRGVAALASLLPEDPERRQVLARAIAGFIAGGASLVGLVGVVNVARGFEIKRVRVPIAKLPKSASGYRIVQLTDVHVGPTIGREFLESVVRASNALDPDMVVITGDLVDGSVEQLRHLVEPLRDLRSRDGVFFVTGNHEYYSGADAWIAHLETLGVRVLRNERVTIRDAFDLAGVDDHSARQLPGHGEDVAGAMRGRDASRAVVLLAHQPKAVREAQQHGVDLQISGHVHGGQLVPFNWLARLDQPFVHGLHRVGDTWIYVSQGTGYWGPPMRVGTHAEVTHIELLASDDAAQGSVESAREG
jgi:predicted MPP superfamily phosphohydrolase